jgi:hypothetical protein
VFQDFVAATWFVPWKANVQEIRTRGRERRGGNLTGEYSHLPGLLDWVAGRLAALHGMVKQGGLLPPKIVAKLGL